MVRRPSVRIVACAVAALALFAACGDPEDETDTAVAQEVAIEAFDFYFDETQFMFDLGAQVTVDFVNAGEATHSFTADDLDIDVEAGSGETTELTFQVPNEPGVFDFYCKYHPDEMKGTMSIGGNDDPINEDAEDEDADDADVEVEVEEDTGAGGGADY